MVPAISVVMSVYNGAQFLREAVESILVQTFKDFEFIIVNDGSTDQTSLILEEYRSQDSRIQIIAQENMGLTYSLNRGLGVAQAPLIARMDADDISAKDRLLWQMEYIDAHPDVDLLGGCYDLIDARGRSIDSTSVPVTEAALRNALLDSTTFLHPSVMMRKRALTAVGGYRDVPYTEDYDLWLRLSERGRIANLSAVIVHYRVHPNQVSISKCGEQALWTAATQAAAEMRRRGEQDLLTSIQVITPDVLNAMGVSKRMQHSASARAYLRYMRNMFHIKQNKMALQAFFIVRSADCSLAERWIVADACFWAAKVHFSDGKILQGIQHLALALYIRPLMLGRPLKALATGVAFQARRANRQLGRIMRSRALSAAHTDAATR